MTTSPSWFPSWPSTFKDIEDAYLRTIPRQWPAGLYNEGTDERRDLDAIAVVMSWVAQGSEWIRQRVFPQYDDGAMMLPLWEEALSLSKSATIALRQAAVIAYCRLMLGTATKATIQKIMAPIFGVDDYTDIDFSFASFANIDAFTFTDEWARAFILCHFHIFDNNGTHAPDRKRALDAIAKFRPSWVRVTVGQHQYAKYDTQGGYDTACYT